MTEIRLADTPDLLERAFQIRREVFVVEQQVPAEEEFDQYEEVSRHWVALDEHQEPVGAARWRRTEKGIKLERFVVKMSHRGHGLGGRLVQQVLDDIQAQEGTGLYLYLHAQLSAVSLYARFGFQPKGEQFLECDIWHYLMERRT